MALQFLSGAFPYSWGVTVPANVTTIESVDATDYFDAKFTSLVGPDVYTAEISHEVHDSAAIPANEFTSVWSKNGVVQTTGVTLGTIQIIKRSDGTNHLAEASMTQIGSTSSWRYDATGTNRLLVGIAYIVKCAATIDGDVRTWYTIVGRDG